MLAELKQQEHGQHAGRALAKTASVVKMSAGTVITTNRLWEGRDTVFQSETRDVLRTN